MSRVHTKYKDGYQSVQFDTNQSDQFDTNFCLETRTCIERNLKIDTPKC